jgi:DNA-directed RNA polymerase subunit RPC12/RpoP
MTITAKCETCGREFPMELSGTRLIYYDGNKREELKDEKADCRSCEEKVGKALEAKREETRASIRAEHQNNG